MGTVVANVLQDESGQYVPRFAGSISNPGNMVVDKVTMSASYATGGDAFSLAGYFTEIVRFCVFFTTGNKYSFVYVPDAQNTPAGGKIFAFDVNGNAEETNAVDLSAQTLTFMAGGL